ncbi:MAG: NusG domain II-containing protein [Clostridium fessum]
MKSKKNRNDFVLILVLLAVILIGFLVVRLQRQKDAFTVDVSVDGTTVATYRLDEEIDTWIDGYQGGQNHLVIQDGCARIEEADCPDKLCVKQGTVSESGESLVCLPQIGWLWRLNSMVCQHGRKRPAGTHSAPLGVSVYFIPQI